MRRRRPSRTQHSPASPHTAPAPSSRARRRRQRPRSVRWRAVAAPGAYAMTAARASTVATSRNSAAQVKITHTRTLSFTSSLSELPARSEACAPRLAGIRKQSCLARKCLNPTAAMIPTTSGVSAGEPSSAMVARAWQTVSSSMPAHEVAEFWCAVECCMQLAGAQARLSARAHLRVPAAKRVPCTAGRRGRRARRRQAGEARALWPLRRLRARRLRRVRELPRQAEVRRARHQEEGVPAPRVQQPAAQGRRERRRWW